MGRWPIAYTGISSRTMMGRMKPLCLSARQPSGPYKREVEVAFLVLYSEPNCLTLSCAIQTNPSQPETAVPDLGTHSAELCLESGV